MTKKLNVYAAIVRALPAKLEKSATFSGTVDALIELFRGDRVHKYAGWNVSGKYCNLNVNADVSRAVAIINEVGLFLELKQGNDAPKGGRIGDYWQFRRSNIRVVRFLTKFLALRECGLTDDQLMAIGNWSVAELKAEKKFMLDVMTGAKLSKSDVAKYTDYICTINTLINGED